MRILVCASPQQQSDLKQSLDEKSGEITFCEDIDFSELSRGIGGLFLLKEKNINLNRVPAEFPVFINEVIRTLAELKAAPNIIRINGWPGFLQRRVWEAAGEVTRDAVGILEIFGKKIIRVKDEPGLVSATIISMLINEAFYASKEGVSTREEIDRAMKLATNYPLGPFEWGEKIGYDKVHQLLTRLSEKEARYTPSFNPQIFFE